MEKLLKNKLLLVGIVVLILVLGIGGFLFFQSRGGATQEEVIEEVTDVKTLKPEDIGLELSISDDNKIISLEAAKLDGITSIEYDISYDAEVTEDGQDFVAVRGVTGNLDIKSGESVVSKDIDLGTCSRNVCKYDNVVGAITFNIRVNYSNGEVGGIETKLELAQ